MRCWGEGANGRLGYCSTNAIGDDETPGSAGPVDLGVPGNPGAGCAPAAPPPTPPPGQQPPPAPPGLAPAPSTPPAPGITPLRLKPDDGLAAQRARAAALRSCLRQVARRASSERRRARRLTASKRRSTLRQITKRAASRRSSCLKRHGRTPGRVTGVQARTSGRRSLKLTFAAAGTQASKPPPARGYLVKQSRRPIRNARDFRRADALCKGDCTFDVEEVGERITLTVTDLRRGGTYYYAVAARDNVSGRIGPRSKTVKKRLG